MIDNEERPKQELETCINPKIESSQAFPSGHFYSPVIDPDETDSMKDRIWPADPSPILGLAFNDSSHNHVLKELFPKYIQDYTYPEFSANDESQFFTQNSQFSWLDSRAAFVLLRDWSPSTIIEVGSGFSSRSWIGLNTSKFTA